MSKVITKTFIKDNITYQYNEIDNLESNKRYLCITDIKFSKYQTELIIPEYIKYENIIGYVIGTSSQTENIKNKKIKYIKIPNRLLPKFIIIDAFENLEVIDLYNISELKSVEIPFICTDETVSYQRYIGYLSWCSIPRLDKLKQINISGKINIIRSGAINMCKNLKVINMNLNEDCQIEQNFVNNCPNLKHIKFNNVYFIKKDNKWKIL